MLGSHLIFYYFILSKDVCTALCHCKNMHTFRYISDYIADSRTRVESFRLGENSELHTLHILKRSPIKESIIIYTVIAKLWIGLMV